MYRQLLQFLIHLACVGNHDTLQILLPSTDKSLVEWDPASETAISS